MFLAARHGNSTIGAAFASFFHNGDIDVVVLDYVVVDPRFRHCGVASALVCAVLDHSPADTPVYCWCAQSSLAMQRLIARLGFTRERKFEMVTTAVGERVLWPSLWIKRR